MMIDEVRGLLDQYAQWVRDKSILREVNEQYVEITTPYLDRHNDYTQIYVRKDDGGVRICELEVVLVQHTLVVRVAVVLEDEVAVEVVHRS